MRIGIITANRPDIAWRCIETCLSLVGESGGSGHMVEVFDNGSPGPLQMRCEVAARRRGATVTYHGAKCRRQLEGVLRAAGVPERLVRFALGPPLGPAMGANRNMALLWNAGRRFVSLDDDVLPTLVRPSLEPVAAPSHRDPRIFAFDMQAAEGKDLVPVPGHFADAHEVLGESIAATPTEGHGGGRGNSGVIRVSMNGLKGTDTLRLASRLLFLSGASRHELVKSLACYRGAYMEARNTRYVKRLAVRRTSFTIGAAIGFDAREILPPFLPFLRGEDALFGECLAIVDPQACTAWLPETLLHQGHGRRRRSEQAIWRSVGPTSAQLLRQLLASCSSGEGRDVRRAIGRLGEQLKETAQVEPKDFMARCLSKWRAHCGRQYQRLQAIRAAHGYTPTFWDDDAARHLTLLAAHATGQVTAWPVDSPTRRDAAWRSLQSLTSDMGDLMQAWPAMWDACLERANREA